MARRSGSPWTGCGAVFVKELADHLGSVRMLILEWLVLLTGIGAVYAAIQDLRVTTSQDAFLFLRLFTSSRNPLPSFIEILGFLIPLMAVGLCFDSVNGEFNRRTLSRVLAQPIYRDALLLGKFLAGLATIAISLVTMWLLVVGLGLVLLGVPPSGEEILRSIAFLLISIAYGGIWLALALFCSVVFRSAATAALMALGVWLFFSVLWPIVVRFLTDALFASETSILLGVPGLEQLQFQQLLERLSPNTLFADSVLALLHPATRALGPVFLEQLEGAVIGAPLPLGQSLLLVWPQVTGLVAGVIALFVATYVIFQRQEVRA